MKKQKKKSEVEQFRCGACDELFPKADMMMAGGAVLKGRCIQCYNALPELNSQDFALLLVGRLEKITDRIELTMQENNVTGKVTYEHGMIDDLIRDTIEQLRFEENCCCCDDD